jgi:hypothetical protein
MWNNVFKKIILGTAFLVKKFLGNKIPWSAVPWNDIPWKKISLLCRITSNFICWYIKFLEELISLKSKKFKINCACMANCDNSNYFIQSSRSRVWFLGANFQFGIIDYPKMQLKRNLLFGFTDVLGIYAGLCRIF